MRLFSGLLESCVVVVEARISDNHTELFREEEAFVSQAVDGRRKEFAAGRACARRAMEQLGCRAVALVPRSDRVPNWPSGLVGSITHDDSRCACAVARRRDGIRSIGIDVEPLGPLHEELWETVLRPCELSWLGKQKSVERGVLARAIFSAKESVFKCQYGVTNAMLEFDEIEILLDRERGAFQAKLVGDVGLNERAEKYDGRVRLAHGAIVSAVTLKDT